MLLSALTFAALLSAQQDALVAGATRDRLLSSSERGGEIILATVLGEANGIVLFSDIESARDASGVESAAGIGWLISDDPAHGGIITSTLDPIEEEQRRPPYYIALPRFLAVAAQGRDFLIVGRELSGDAHVFVATISVDPSKQVAHLIPELLHEPIATSRLVSDGTGAWWFYDSDGVLNAARVSRDGLVFGPHAIAPIDVGDRDAPSFSAAVREDGSTVVVWLHDGALWAADFASDGMIISPRVLIDRAGVAARTPVISRYKNGFAVAWLVELAGNAAVRVGAWMTNDECVMPLTDMSPMCVHPRDLRLDSTDTPLLGWRCADTATVHAQWVVDRTTLPAAKVPAGGKYFDLDCDGDHCAIWWQERATAASDGMWLWRRTLSR